MIILASTSAARQRMLTAAGVPYDALAPQVDEDALTATLVAAAASAEEIAATLAAAKALEVSTRTPGRLVLGADTVLTLGKGQMLGKPQSAAGVAQHLRLLSGRDHHLVSAAVLAENGAVVWRHTQMPRLVMRPLTDAFIADYVQQVGEKVKGSVGAYHFEGLGVQLFERVEGDYFSILGLPLLPLLAELRQRGVLAA